MKKRLFGALCVIAVLLGSVMGSWAIDPIDGEMKNTLTVWFHHGELNIPGCEFSLYRVADSSEFADFTYTEEFSLLETDVSSPDGEVWKALDRELPAYISGRGISPVSVLTTGKEGRCTFTELGSGLYYAVGTAVLAEGWVYTPMPILISLPNREAHEHSWDHQVDFAPKYSRETEKTDLRVKKAWEDAGQGTERPASVTVELFCDGESYDTVTLSRENNWEHVWTELEAAHTWTLEEKPVPGYTPEVRREGNTFFVTNTENEPPPPPPGLPPTGQLWWPVPLLCVAGLGLVLLGILVGRKRQ